MKYQYKTETFGREFPTKNGFTKKLQELLDLYAAAGWRLHTVQTPGYGVDFCTCVFERQIEE